MIILAASLIMIVVFFILRIKNQEDFQEFVVSNEKLSTLGQSLSGASNVPLDRLIDNKIVDKFVLNEIKNKVKKPEDEDEEVDIDKLLRKQEAEVFRTSINQQLILNNLKHEINKLADTSIPLSVLENRYTEEPN